MVNQVFLIGRCGREPEVRDLEGGNRLATITLATSEKYKTRDGEEKEITEWHTVVIFGKPADFVKNYVHSGDLLYVNGKIRTRSWQDKDNTMHFKTEIVAGTIQKLGRNDKPHAPQKVEEDLPDFLNI